MRETKGGWKRGAVHQRDKKRPDSIERKEGKKRGCGKYRKREYAVTCAPPEKEKKRRPWVTREKKRNKIKGEIPDPLRMENEENPARRKGGGGHHKGRESDNRA